MILLALVTILEAATAREWEWVYPKASGMLASQMVVAADRTIWVSGTSGEVLRSIDSGRTFTRCAKAGTHTLVSIAVIDSDSVIVVSDVGSAMVSTDAGQTWSAWTLPDSIAPHAVHYSSERVFYIGADSGALYASADLREWHLTQLETDHAVTLISTQDDRLLAAAGQSVWTVSLSSKDISRRSLPDVYAITSMRFDSTGNAWLATNAGSYLLRFDGPPVANRLSRICEDIASRDGRTVLAGLRGLNYVVRSTDSGVTFDTVLSATSELRELVFLGETDWCAYTLRGPYHSSDDGLTWESANVSIWSTTQLLHVNSAVMVAFGQYGSTVRTTNAGLDWKLLIDPKLRGAQVMCLCNDGVLFASSYERLHRSSDGGLTWETTTMTNRWNPLSIVCPGHSDSVYLMLESSTQAISFAASVDGGRTWDTITSLNSWQAHPLFLPGGKIVRVEFGHSLSISPDRGQTWISLPVADKAFWSVWGPELGDLWALDTAYNVHHSIDTGRTWSFSIGPYLSSYARVTPKSHLAIQQIMGQFDIVGSRLLTSTDDGATWTSDTLPNVTDAVLTVANGYIYLSSQFGLLRSPLGSLTSVEHVPFLTQTMDDVIDSVQVNSDVYLYSYTGSLNYSFKAANSTQVMEDISHVASPGLWFVYYTDTSGRLRCSRVFIR